MCRLIESIKLQNGQLQNVKWHNKRFNESRKALFGIDDHVDLEQLIIVPHTLDDGIYKCRVLYERQIEVVEFQPYVARCVRSLRLLECNDIDYEYKYENRLAFDKLMALKGAADDILVAKAGHITDTSYSNIVFSDGEKWVTPDTWLLNGTQRRHLLADGIITEANITTSSLKRYKWAKPINAMLDFEATPLVKILF
jgi:4-amino-4-deoxychorismate lyase